MTLPISWRRVAILPAAAFVVAVATGPAVGAAQGAAQGHRVFGDMDSVDTVMVDSEEMVDQVWTSAFPASVANKVDRNGSLLRVIKTDPLPLGGAGGGLQRVALDGTVLWDFRYDSGGVLSHHDITELPNGNVLMIAWEEKTEAEAIQAGRNPARVSGTFRPEHVIEVRQTGLTTGEIVWEWHLWDHLIQDFDPARDNFGVVADHPELVDINYPDATPFLGDWVHMNGIDYDPVYDRIILSADRQSEIWVIDHSTTTEEAAGHTGGRWGRGGDILYRWGNPEAYRAGGPGDRVFRTQHSPRVIEPGYPGEGNYLVFLNNEPGQFGRSAVYELVPPLDANGAFILDPSGRYGPEGPVWSHSEPGFYSPIVSSVERLRNGNTLICSGTQARVFEVDAAGQTVWDYDLGFGSVFNAHYVERWLWADRLTLSTGDGGRVEFDLLAGSEHGGMDYFLLASRSGTEPGVEIGDVTLPLNPDALTELARQNPNSEIFVDSLGALDSLGRAEASFDLPAGSPLEPGDTVHFAYLVADPGSGEIVFASDPVAVSVTE